MNWGILTSGKEEQEDIHGSNRGIQKNEEAMNQEKKEKEEEEEEEEEELWNSINKKHSNCLRRRNGQSDQGHSLTHTFPF